MSARQSIHPLASRRERQRDHGDRGFARAADVRQGAIQHALDAGHSITEVQYMLDLSDDDVRNYVRRRRCAVS